jgi:hypothetical protein
MNAPIDLRFIVILTFLIILVSCEKPDVSENSNLVNSLNASSRDTIEIGTNKYILEAYLSRDFMPGYQRKRPLVALIYLVNIDSLPISSNVDISKLYVIKDQLIWTSNPVDSNQPQVPDFKIDKLRNDGPEWDVDTYVDVVAEVINKSTNDKFLIIARQQKIQRLD